MSDQLPELPPLPRPLKTVLVSETVSRNTGMLSVSPGEDVFTSEQMRAYALSYIAASQERLRLAIHYPECWDTAAYPELHDALNEVKETFDCTNEICKIKEHK